MADFNPDAVPGDLGDLAKELPEGIDMDQFIENVTRMAMEFMKEQSDKPVQMQLIIFFGFLLIPVSLILIPVICLLAFSDLEALCIELASSSTYLFVCSVADGIFAAICIIDGNCQLTEHLLKSF